MMKHRHAIALTVVLLLGFSSAADAEYLIYLKGGHFVVADDCTFFTGQVVEKDPQTGEQPPEFDCTKGNPAGSIFWRTIDGSSGELNLDDVYAIFGTKSLPPIKPAGATMPLEDYLIINRDGSFVNATVVEEVAEKDADVYGFKRGELIKVSRRGLIEIAPERLIKSQSRSRGLCPGEPDEFAVSEVEIWHGRLLGVVTNLSKDPWKPWIDVEVSVKGKRRGKFQIEDPVVHAPLPNILEPDESTSIDQLVPARLLSELEHLDEVESGVRLCYRKIKTNN